jgi:hypothetical protein
MTNKGIIYLASVLNNIRCIIKQIYHVWEGYLWKIPVLRLNFPRHLALETVLKFKIFIAYLYCIDNNAKVKSLHLLNVSMAGSITPVLYLLNRLLRSGNKSRQLKENLTKFPSPFGSGNFSSFDWYFSQIPLQNMIYLHKIIYHYCLQW